MIRQIAGGRGMVVVVLAAGVIGGCADMRSPNMQHALSHPWGTQDPFQRGQTKQEVVAEWGEPDETIPLGVEETGLLQEEWVYVGRYPDVPVDYKYLSKSKRLIFAGDYLVRWYDEPVKTNEAAATETTTAIDSR